MYSFISVIIIGVALSMDTFSLSLTIGTLNIPSKKILLTSIIVGIMHFFMPLIGLLIGKQILTIFPINHNLLVAIILGIIAIMMIKDLFSESTSSYNLTMIGIIAFAFSVSIDSFSTGVGLKAITNNYFIAALTFALCSFSFTYTGLTIGKYSQEKIGKIANIIGIILLLVISIEHLLYCF